MKYQKSLVYSVIILLLLTCILGIGCNEEKNNPTAPSVSTPPTTVPGGDDLTGEVVGTVLGQPLAGVTVSARGKIALTDANGIFQLNDVGSGTFGVVVSGNSIYTRTAAVDTASGRFVRLDAIERNSNFHLGFYQELARGNHPQEGDLFQTHRWTNPTPPTFYIDTDASVTLDKVIDQAQINLATNVINQVVSVFSGGFYASVPITTRAFNRLDFDLDIPDNSFVISFDDRLIYWDAYGYTETDPNFVSPTTSIINKVVVRLLDSPQFYTAISMEEIIAHEMGHGFGFRHTSLLSSVMIAVGAFGGLYSESDRLHMAVMYKRPAGNTDIDNDPVPGAKMFGSPIGKQVFIDNRANFPKSPELLEQVRALPNKLPDIGVK